MGFGWPLRWLTKWSVPCSNGRQLKVGSHETDLEVGVRQLFYFQLKKYVF